MIHVSIKPDILFHVYGFPISNTLITSWLVMIVLIAIALYISKRIHSIPSRVQAAAEAVIEGLLNFLEVIAGSRESARRHFPLIATIFFFILLSNWLGIFPGVGTIGFWEESHAEPVEEEIESEIAGGEDPQSESALSESSVGETGEVSSLVEEGVSQEIHAEEESSKLLVPLLRSANSDLNVTLAYALIVVTFSHIIGMSAIGAAHHVEKFFSFKNPINFFVGILEFLGEFSKIVSFSFRLFGNIFAGEVLLVIISFLVPYLVPIPFLGLELFVGVVQAGIFAVLAMIFFSSMEKMPAH